MVKIPSPASSERRPFQERLAQWFVRWQDAAWPVGAAIFMLVVVLVLGSSNDAANIPVALLLALGAGLFIHATRRSTRHAVDTATAVSTATVRLAALALQARGRLELALKEFSAQPPSKVLRSDLYYLAKAFERKRDFVHAAAVFERIDAESPEFRDVAVRMARAQKLAVAQVQAQAEPGSAPPARRALEKPEKNAAPLQLGRYLIAGTLGSGAMGHVYAARDPLIGRQVAIKTLALGAEFDGQGLVDARERFFREAESAGRLAHPNIVAIHDVGDDGSQAWIAMEYLNGLDLSKHCEREQLLPLEQVLSIAQRVATALDYAHSRQVVHRDIKPSNIVFHAATDAVKVTDFGIARITDSNKTRTGVVLGTPSFMAPEQLAGAPVDGRADIYALGVTVFQLLTGALPLRGESLGQLMQAIAHQVPPDVRRLRRDIPAPVANIVRLCLQKKPADRFQTGAQLAAAFHACLLASSAVPAPLACPAVDYHSPNDFKMQPMPDYPDTVVESVEPFDATLPMRAAV